MGLLLLVSRQLRSHGMALAGFCSWLWRFAR